SIPNNRNRYGASVFAGPDGRIYNVAGGDGATPIWGTVFIYDPQTGAWNGENDFPKVPQARVFAGAGIIGNFLYVVGGVSTENISERYDFSAGKWTRNSDDVGFYFSRGPAFIDGDNFLALGGNDGKAASAGYPDDPTTSPVTGAVHAFSEQNNW